MTESDLLSNMCGNKRENAADNMNDYIQVPPQSSALISTPPPPQGNADEAVFIPDIVHQRSVKHI